MAPMPPVAPLINDGEFEISVFEIRNIHHENAKGRKKLQ
jgi:hypothetical protein